MSQKTHPQDTGRFSRPVAAVCLLLALGILAVGFLRPEWMELALAVPLACGTAIIGFALLLRVRHHRLEAMANRIEELERLRSRHDAAEALASLGTWVQVLSENRLEWSPGAFRLFGINPENGPPSPKGFLICLHRDDQRRWSDLHRRVVRNGGEAKIEYRYLRPNGETVWVRSVARPVRGRDGTIDRLEGIVLDISGMRAMQRQLAASESKFRELTQLSSDWIWETDAQHRLSWLSDSVDAVLGQWKRRWIGRRRWEGDGVAAESMPADWAQHRQVLDAHKPFENFEVSRLDDDGNVYHLSLSGRPVFDDSGRFVGYRGTGRNITREKQQRMLLEIDGDIASIMREQTDPERVVTAVLITVCGKLAWLGGAHMVRADDGFAVRERWGHPTFVQMLAELPAVVSIAPDSVEAKAWNLRKAVWLSDVVEEPAFAKRYQTAAVGAQAAFLAPILNEHDEVMSVLLFLSPVSLRGDAFLGQVAEVLSRTLSLYLQRKAAEKQLLHASLHDALTDLPNRAFVSHQLKASLKRRREVALLYIDLDRYKLINDTLGHAAGDKVLVEVAARLKAAIRPGDTAGRMGGDEFIVLLNDISDRAEIEAIARQVLASIEKPFILNNRAYFLSASIGVALSPEDTTDPQQLIKAADGAMYKVKSEGRNDVQFFAGKLSDERTEQMQLAAELPMAISRDEVDLFYQPILDVAQRKVVSIEGLLRWRHPVRGLLLPEKFLPMAEQSNLIREIGFWAVRRAIDDRIRLGLDRFEDMAVTVNISVRQLAEDGFLENLNRLMSERGFPPKLLRLELTESSFIENPEKTIQLIGELRRLGVAVIIDNFGTGYASLSYIKNLPVDGLKIDGAFVRNLPADRGNAAIVQAITTLAAKLGMRAMAEGVETAAEMRGLRELDCEVMQGTLIYEPVPYAELADLLESLPALRQMHLAGGPLHAVGSNPSS